MAFSSLFEMFFIFFRHFQCLFKSLLIVLLHSYSLFTIYNFFEYLSHKFINSIFSSVHLHRFAKFIIIKINRFITKSIICVSDRSYIWWPNLNKEIELIVKGSEVCQSVEKLLQLHHCTRESGLLGFGREHTLILQRRTAILSLD